MGPSGLIWDILHVIKNFWPSTQLKRATRLEIEKDQSGAGIRGKVTKGIEHGIAEIVGNTKGLVIDNRDEPGVTATVRGIHPSFRMGASHKERVSLRDDGLLCWTQDSPLF